MFIAMGTNENDMKSLQNFLKYVLTYLRRAMEAYYWLSMCFSLLLTCQDIIFPLLFYVFSDARLN